MKIDLVKIIKEDSHYILPVNRDRLYDIDKEYWSTVVSPESKGFDTETILELGDLETLPAAISTLTFLSEDTLRSRFIHTTLGVQDIIPALAFISRFNTDKVKECIINLTRRLLELSGRILSEIWDPLAISLLDPSTLDQAIRQWDINMVKNGGWKIMMCLPRHRPIDPGVPRYNWFWIRAFENGYIHTLPSLFCDTGNGSILNRYAYSHAKGEYWKDTSKKIHSAMRKAIPYETYIGKIPIVNINKALESIGISVKEMCEIAVRVLGSDPIHVITSTMKLFMDHILPSKIEKKHISSSLSTCKEIITGRYKDMESPLTGKDLDLHIGATMYSPDVWNVYLLSESSGQKRLASLHILSYGHQEDDSWYSSYIDTIRTMMKKLYISIPKDRSNNHLSM